MIFFKMKKYKEMYDDCKIAESIKGKTLDSSMIMGIAKQEDGKYEEAIQIFDQVLVSHPNFFSASICREIGRAHV